MNNRIIAKFHRNIFEEQIYIAMDLAGILETLD